MGRFISLGIPAIRFMLRRLTYLPILLLSLLLGTPVFASCVGSESTCCPDGPGAPCRIDGSSPPGSIRLSHCCASDVGASADAIAEPIRTPGKHATPIDPPPGIATLASSDPSDYARPPRVIPATSLDYQPSNALLYLSTARLRL